MISTFMTLRVDRVDSIPLSTLASAVNSLSIGETFLVSFTLQYRYGFLIFIHALRFRFMVDGEGILVSQVLMSLETSAATRRPPLHHYYLFGS